MMEKAHNDEISALALKSETGQTGHRLHSIYSEDNPVAISMSKDVLRGSRAASASMKIMHSTMHSGSEGAAGNRDTLKHHQDQQEGHQISNESTESAAIDSNSHMKT